MSLPQSLAVSLRRFSDGICSTQRVLGQQTAYPSASVLQFNLPRQGTLLLDSISLLADFFTTHSAVLALTTPSFHSQIFRKVDFICGGTSVSLNSLSDYGFAYLYSKLYSNTKAKSDYEQSVGLAGSVDVSTINGSVTTPIVLANDWLGFLGAQHMNVLPLDLLPECSIVVSLHDRSRWTTADNSAVGTMELRNARLMFKMISFADNMLSKLWAQKLSVSSVVIPFQNISYAEGSASSATANTYNGTVNTQSLDLIMVGQRKGDYDTVYANRWLSSAGNNTTTVNNQVYFNGVPISSWGLVPIESLIETQAALEGVGGNILYSPDLATFANYRDSFFVQVHKMGTPVLEAEARGMVTGVPTYGQSLEISYLMSGGDGTSKKPFIMCFYTSTMELGAGKQVAVAP